MVPSLIGPLDSCLFRNRCPYAFDACAAAPIALRQRGSERACRCLLDDLPYQPNRGHRPVGASP
jgi:peptide/nickel transport system ATP-binding protein